MKMGEILDQALCGPAHCSHSVGIFLPERPQVLAVCGVALCQSQHAHRAWLVWDVASLVLSRVLWWKQQTALQPREKEWEPASSHSACSHHNGDYGKANGNHG